MKNIIFIILGVLFSVKSQAQNDTMYIMESGQVIGIYKVSRVDSIIFYKPAIVDSSIVTDYDGNIYNTLTLGTQTWMRENLRTTHYANGIPIPKIENNTEWDGLTSFNKAYCWYNNDSATNSKKYGALYTWAAAMNGAVSSSAVPSGVQGVCPTGWHLPSDQEWTVLQEYLIANGYNYNGSTTDNLIAKSLASTSTWTPSDTVGAPGNVDFVLYRNKTGFSANSSGLRYYGAYIEESEDCFWWSSTEYTPETVWDRYLYYNKTSLNRNNNQKRQGMSVRCIKD